MSPTHDEFDDRLRDAKLAALAEFAAGAGHEINNPVATILGRAQQLLGHESDPSRRRSLAVIASQALRIRDMIGDLMLFARPPEPQPGWHDLSAIVQGTIEPLRELASERGIEVDFHPTETLRCFVDPLQIAVAVTAIIENAINASSDGGRVTVTVFAGNGTCGVLVEDRGIGFTPADRAHAFDPFYSGRQAGRGLGFGLPKAWRIVTLAGGTIALESQPGRTLARIELPSGPSQPEAEPADPTTTAEAKTSRRRRR